MLVQEKLLDMEFKTEKVGCLDFHYDVVSLVSLYSCLIRSKWQKRKASPFGTTKRNIMISRSTHTSEIWYASIMTQIRLNAVTAVLQSHLPAQCRALESDRFIIKKGDFVQFKLEAYSDSHNFAAERSTNNIAATSKGLHDKWSRRAC
jgi:hypothetical protein